MKPLSFHSVSHIPFEGFENLKLESIREGFRFLKRLETEWSNPGNPFTQQPAGLYTAWYGRELAGIGGITLDPFPLSQNLGRLRRIYIHPLHRRKGIGRSLIQFLLYTHPHSFGCIRLFSDSPAAQEFYEKLGFQPIQNVPHVSHQIFIKTP